MFAVSNLTGNHCLEFVPKNSKMEFNCANIEQADFENNYRTIRACSCSLVSRELPPPIALDEFLRSSSERFEVQKLEVTIHLPNTYLLQVVHV